MMDMLENFNKDDGSLWNPVLHPERIPINNDLLGYKYVFSNQQNAYQRTDGEITTFDNHNLKFTCYLKMKSSKNQFESNNSLGMVDHYDEHQESVPSLTSLEGTKFVFWLTINKTENEDLDQSLKSFIIYFHSHGANRQEGRFLLDFADSKKANLCLMDMRASGESGGSCCTLGIRESKDVEAMIRKLKRQFKISRVILYGRSMGAASVLNFVSLNWKGTTNFKIKHFLKLRGLFLIRHF
jgi:hypothetical protein